MAVPSRTIWRRPLMVRQPYSVAVPSTGGRLHPPLPEEEGLGEKVELSLQERRRGRKNSFLNGKEGRVGFRKKPFLMGKSDANECNESSLSNCRVQLALSTKNDGMILEKTFPLGDLEVK